ncbi:MAG: hypothetical protein ACM31N_05995 [Deltaproteobacteria bacterium]
MIKKYFLKTLLILSVSTIFILTLSGTGICIDKTKIDLSEYKGSNTNRTFKAYKYAFGDRTQGTLQFVYTDVENGFHLDWYEVYDDGEITSLGLDYKVTAEGSFEKNIYRYDAKYGDYLTFVYRDLPNGLPPNPNIGNEKPLLTFPYAVVNVGYMWGDAFVEKGNREAIYYPRVYQFAILGLEDVTVPAGTFTDCVKIARFRGNQADRISWHAKGIGMVKIIYAQEEHSLSIADTQYQVQGYNRAFVLQSLDN